ncbi:hypothetical protein [Maricaulis parjimensis]|uniref:hypothetical protein n=1 Tax=Maricaulis parjimensis TaxID=144023 RepID=UPI0019393DE6|nr:hypothetical protein [Maricaulis parjimensis]
MSACAAALLAGFMLVSSPALAEGVADKAGSALAKQDPETPPGPGPAPTPDPTWPPLPTETQELTEPEDLFDLNGDGCTSQEETTQAMNDIDVAILGYTGDHALGNGAALGGAAWADFFLGQCQD